MPGGVEFNPDKRNLNAGNVNGANAGINNGALINQRGQYEGPSQDTVQLSSQSGGKKSAGNLIDRAVTSFVGWVWGDKSSEIKFLDSAVKKEDGTGYVLSEPFSAPDDATANNSARSFYELQKGKVQRNTGNLWADVGAQKNPDGKYVVTASNAL